MIQHQTKLWAVTQCFLFTFIFIAGSYSVNAAEKQFRAGAARSNITPPLGELIVGGFKPFPATNVHDELHARALVLDDGSTKIAIVICDNIGIVRDVIDEARKLITTETKLSASHILLAGTHTHSGTRAQSKKYRHFLARRITDTVRRALANIEPARIGWGSVMEPSEVHNRRWHVTNKDFCKNPFGGVDTVRMNPPRANSALVKPAGPVDPEISFISVQATDGRPIALLANYSLHYVGGVNKGDISADYFGLFSEQIGQLIGAKKHSPPFVGMLSNGTSGDVNNINFQKKYPRMKRYEKMKQVADLIAKRVTETHKNIKFHNWVPIDAASRELTLKVRKPNAAMQKYFAKILAKPEDAPVHHRYERIYAARVQKLLDGPDNKEVTLQAIRIGNLSIAAIPFEVFTEIGLEIKEKTPFNNAFTIEIANGYEGYLPTPAQHQLGGYETWMGTNRVQKDASELITKTILDLMTELKRKK